MKKVTLAILFAALTLVYANEIIADEFNLIPSIALRQEYNDNIFFDDEDENEIDDSITTVSPGLELVDRTERLDLNLSARADAILYEDNDELDDVDQIYRGRISYRITPKMRISTNAGYAVDSRRDRDIEETGLVMMGTVKRKRWNGGLSGDFTLTEKSATALSYTYQEDEFDDLEFDDYEFHTANLGFTHDLSKIFSRTVGRVNIGYSHYDAEDNTTIDNVYGTLGFSRALTEIFNFFIDVGVRYTASETEYDWGPMGRFVLSYTGEVTSASISASNELRPASGRSGTADRTSFLFEISRRFTEKFRVQLSGEYFLNKADARELSTTDIDEQTISIRPALSYEIINDLILTGSYSFTKVKDQIDNTEPKRNLVWLQLTCQYPLFE